MPPELAEPETPPAADQPFEPSERMPTQVVPAEEPLLPEAPATSELPHRPITVTTEPMEVDATVVDEHSTPPSDSEPRETAADQIVEGESPNDPPAEDLAEPLAEQLVVEPNTRAESSLIAAPSDAPPVPSPSEPPQTSTDWSHSNATDSSGKPETSPAERDDRNWGPSSTGPNPLAWDAVPTNRRLVRPLAVLRDGLDKLAGGDLQYRIPLDTQDELGLLAQTLNAIAAELRETFGALEQRVSDRTRRLAVVAALAERLSAILELDELFLC